MVPPAAGFAAKSSASDSNFVAAKKNGSACRTPLPHGCSDSGFQGVNLAIAAEIARDWHSCVQRFVISGVKLGNRCEETLKNSQTAASILDFRARFGNRCKFFLENRLFRASILKFKPRLGNRCKETLGNSLIRALILDFWPRLANRCSTIVVAVENGPPAGWRCGRRRGQDVTKAA